MSDTQFIVNTADARAAPARPIHEAIALRGLAERFLAPPEPLSPGDLVCWKAGLRNNWWPRYGQPMVVVEVLPFGTLAPQEGGVFAGHFRERADVVVGWRLSPNEHFRLYGVDRRRIRKMTLSEAIDAQGDGAEPAP